MNCLAILVLVLVGLFSGWLGWQLLRQNGRILLRLDELESRLDEWEFSDTDDQLATTPTATNEVDRASRFKNRSLTTRSKIKRDGLKAGTPAPDFQLPRLDGQGDLALEQLRGRPVLLVFSDPDCGPCNAIAPELERFHRDCPGMEVLMISRGDPRENRAKIKEHGLSFSIVLQQQWEISRRYAMFATPIAYLIDETGVIASDVAVGVEPILAMLTDANRQAKELALH